MDDAGQQLQDWHRFLAAVLNEDGPTLHEVSEILGGHQGIILLTCFVAIIVPERFSNATFEDFSRYAGRISNEVGATPRKIVIEAICVPGMAISRV